MRDRAEKKPLSGHQSPVRAGRDALRDAIAQEEALLVKLQAELTASRQRLAVLGAELAELEAEPEIRVHLPLSLEAPIPRTSADKVRLFRSLFRGREDILPTRFESARTGKTGYAPACRNKFVRGVCELPKVKCGDCPNQAFIPVDDSAVVGHLTGRHVMGVYPLLEDETAGSSRWTSTKAPGSRTWVPLSILVGVWVFPRRLNDRARAMALMFGFSSHCQYRPLPRAKWAAT
jgi:hypothetical protein